MSIKVMSKVFEWSESEGTDRLVMLALADFCDDDHICYPGIGRVAKKCRISERTVQRSMMSLQKLGELHREMGAGVEVKGKGFTNRYELRFKRPGCQTDTSNGDRGDKQGLNGVTRLSPKSSVQTTRESTLSLNGLNGSRGRKKFTPPSIKEIEARCIEIGLDKREAVKFFNWHDSRGWKVGRMPMVNWKSALNTWKDHYDERREQNAVSHKKTTGEPNGWKEWLAGRPEYAVRCKGLPYSACPEFMRLEFARERKALSARS